MEYVLHIPIKQGIKLVKKAMDEDTKEYAFRIYLASYPNMDKKNFKTFNQFYDDIKPRNVA